MKNFGLVFALVAPQIFCCAAQALTLVREGKPTSVFVTADKPTEAASLAVTTLRDYLKKSTGADVPVMAESKLSPPAGGGSAPGGGDSRVRILVGESKRTAALGIDASKFEREQILLKTFANELVIIGNDRRPDGLELRGTVWAAAQFAEKYLGVRQLWPGPLGEVVPKRATIEIPALDETYIPPLWQRQIRNIGLNERVQRCLDKLGWSAGDFKKLHAQADAWWQFHRIGGSFKGNYGHAFGDYWERFHKDHPDWFALQPDGTRDNSKAGDRCRLCKSNRGLIEQVARDAIEKMKSKPQLDTVSISPNDGGRATFCLCPNCEAWDAKDGETIEMWGPKGPIKHVSLTDRFVRFYAAVGEIVVKEYPNRFLGAYAYSAYRIPPLRAKLPPNVMIGYVGFGYLNESKRQKAREEWLKWSQVANKLFLRPNLLTAGHGLPLVYTHKLADDLRFCAEHGMLVTDFDCCYQHWATDGLNYYVLARVLWDPKLDVDQIIDDYCKAGFGNAAPAVKAYFTALEKMTDELAQSNEYEDRKATMDVLVKRYTDEFLAQLHGHLDEGKRLAAGDAEILARIQFLETGIRYAPLRRDWTLAVGEQRANPTKAGAAKVKETLERKEAFYQQLGISWALNVPYLKFYGF
jgi:hypothetical protein